MPQRPLQRVTALFVTGLSVVTMLFAPLAPVFADGETGTPSHNPAAGVGGGIPVAVLADTGRVAEQAYDTIWTQITRAVMVAFFNALQIFFSQLAYDAANYIASGGQGQDSVFYRKGFDGYFQDVFGDAAGEFIGSISSSNFFQNIGFDLCRPSDPHYLLRLQLSLGNFFPGLQGRFQRQSPRCNWRDIKNNWQTFASSVTPQDLYKSIDVGMQTNQNDFGVSASILGRFQLDIGRKLSASVLDRQEGQGFKATKDILTGNVKTPSAVILEKTKSTTVTDPANHQTAVVGAMLSTGFQQGALQLLQYTASVFLNTLVSKSMQRLFGQGIAASIDLPRQNVSRPDEISVSGKTDARNANIDLRTPTLFKVSTFEVMAEFVACPESRGSWNCVMDQSLAQALQAQSEQGGYTIQEALNRGYLHESWRLIPNTPEHARENTDPQCFTYAYCAGNLAKLRLLRVLPVGVEFAANSPENIARCASSQGCMTLGEVVANFNECGPDKPWCKLVDPNWVITLPAQQCALKGFGDNLLSPQIGQRKEECQDVQTCLQRNDKGECVGGYGYCLAERTVYRFGASECPAQFSSCRQYANRAGGNVGYLRNTLDYARCDATNVGCSWYASTRNGALGENGWIGTTTTGARVYFDKTLESCPADQEGCTKVYAGEYGKPSLNVLLNPSFEKTSLADATKLASWDYSDNRTYNAPTVTAGQVSLDGTRGASLDARGTGSLKQSVVMQPGRVYTLSFYARSRFNLPNTTLKAAVVEYADEGLTTEVPSGAGSLMSRLYRSSGCVVGGPVAGRFYPGVDFLAAGADWQRVTCSFLTTSSTRAGQVQIWGETNATDALVDAVQLEESEFATDFVDGINQSLSVTHLKIAPDEYQCKGDSNDIGLCSKFARVCQQADAGCDAYTDTKLGGSSIPAIVTTNDLCPASCVGYGEFRKQATPFDLVQDVDDRFNDPQESTSTYFIPSTATQCKAEDVGCEEFTNIETGAAGGEQKAYFSYLRACRKPGNDAKTFFTWEGSDVSGYQLRTWNLVKDEAVIPGPKVVLKRQPGDLYFKESSYCNPDSYASGSDPDCRQFYDEAGNAFYRYYSQTVLSTANCIAYRLNVTNRADCELTDGAFNAATGECVYQAYVPESTSCKKEAVACRAYAGSTAGGLSVKLSAAFRSTTDQFSSGSLSDEALIVGDKSLLNTVPAGSVPVIASTTVSNTDENALYRVTFWAKGTQQSQVDLFLASTDDLVNRRAIGSVTVTTDWQRFVVGPFRGAPGTSESSLAFAFSAGAARRSFFLDEVSVVELGEVEYAIEESWNTPAECDRTQGGNELPFAMLGCREYKNRSNQSLNIRSFSKLCREQAVGCRAFVDTRNSIPVESQTFVRGDVAPGFGFPSATTTRQADRMMYLIDSPDKHCRAENASCRAFGKPMFAADRQSLTGFQNVYVKDDITQYGDALCKPSEQFCEEFTTEAGSEYFRDPGTHACEYRTDVDGVSGVAGLPNGQYEGWFIKGTNTPCYPQLLSNGKTFAIAKIADQPYQGWGGECGRENAECSEFRDSNDTSDPRYPSGRPYYFLKDDKLDTRSCAGQIDPAKGCVLLNDMTDAFKKYRTDASYAKYQAAGYTPMTGLDCTSNPRDPACNNIAGKCRGPLKYCSTPDCAAGSVFYQTDLTAAEIAWSALGRGGVFPGSTVPWEPLINCKTDNQCADVAPIRTPDNTAWYQRQGTCQIVNDANIVVKAKLDRDCSQWLGCSSSETVLEPGTNKYKDLCTSVAMCNQASQTPGDVFCGGYVDRSSTSTEPVLVRGAFFDKKQYTSREVGLGKLDYTGYAIPNAFQAVDLSTRRVAIEGLGAQDPTVKYRFPLDYRLVAAVKMPFATESGAGSGIWRHISSPRYFEAQIISRDTPLGRANARLNLCRQIATDRIGYFIPEEVRVGGARPYCYLPVRPTGDAFDFQTITQKFGLANPTDDAQLSQAFPTPECRAQPESDAPYQQFYVTDWDTNLNPPKAKAKIAGYQNANTCEYGEECSCTYKRAEFTGAALSKFYNPNSQNIPPGICQGGPRDGQSCLPDAVFHPPDAGSQSTPEGQAKAIAINKANESQTCGPIEGGGRCVAFSRVSVIRGVFGQCLERDATRAVGNDLGRNPCLTWNPTPILFGDKDNFHYTPTTGYNPPQNSGQYYCLTESRSPINVHMDASYFVGPPFAGGMSHIDYDRHYYEDNNFCFPGYCTNNQPGAFIDSSSRTPHDVQNPDNCKRASGHQLYQSNENDPYALRLVSSGRSTGNSYSEAFFKARPESFSTLIPPGESYAGSSQADIGTRDTTISYFNINPIDNPNGTGRLACGYQAEWVDGIDQIDYGKPDDLRNAERNWREKFTQAWSSVISRASETYITNADNRPLVGPCVDNGISAPRNLDASKCFFKTWESGYRTDAQSKKFIGIFQRGADNVPDLTRLNDTDGFDTLRSVPTFEHCDAEKPYFAIRAVFQAHAPSNAADLNNIQSASQIQSNWNFVGFWVTTCAGNANDYRYMYMTVDVNSSKICRELAEVRSVNSRQDAAFTDRVWREGQYNVPQLGIQYGSRYSPFSSVLNVKKAGLDPLFLAGSELSGFSRTNPPSFLGSPAQTYFSSNAFPKDKWAHLSNLFARIYRIYRYEDQVVTPTSRICINRGRSEGRLCDQNGQCSVNGSCDLTLVTDAEKNSLKFCNSLSGINAGLACTARNLDEDLCHQAPMARDVDGGGYKPLREACILNTRAGWSTVGTGDALRYVNGTSTLANQQLTQPQAASRVAFVCDTDSVRAGQPCGKPEADSPACPTKVTGVCVRPQAFCEGPFSQGSVVYDAAVPPLGRCAIVRSAKAVAAMGTPMPRTKYPTTSFSCAGQTDRPNPVFVYPAANYVGEEYAGCITDTDCNFDEWNFWSQTKIPYGYTPAQAGSTPSYADDAATHDGYLWGPIFSVRSAKNREDGAGNGVSTRCEFTQTQSATVWTSGYTYGIGNNQIGLCLATMPIHDNTLLSGYVGYTPPGADCRNNGDIQGLIGCTGANVYGPFVNSGANPLSPNVWNSVASNAGLWPHRRPEGFVCTGAGCDSRVPALRHPNELRRPPGVGEAGKGKPTEDGGTTRGRNNGYQYNIVDGGDFYLNLAQCETVGAMASTLLDPPVHDLPVGSTILASGGSTQQFGRCVGGIYNGRLCRSDSGSAFIPNSPYSCSPSDASEEERNGICSGITPADCNGTAPGSTLQNASRIRNMCYPDGCNATAPVTGQPINACLHDKGYHPRPDLCRDENDEFCGLFSYDRTNQGSMNPSNTVPLPTDVTIGHYTPYFLGFTNLSADYYKYVGYYTPRPPMVAAPDITRCASPGECAISSMNRFSFNGQGEGIVSVAGGQYKSSIKFYAWAAHNQMPLRRLVVDWGDGFRQELPDAKLKNHKPFCGVQKECWTDPVNGFTGLTCQTDSDCPAGGGVCKTMGYCSRRQNVMCSSDDDCTEGSAPNLKTDTCISRTYFGDSPDACETNYFDFEHVYACNESVKAKLPACLGTAGVTYVSPADVTAGKCYYAAEDASYMQDLFHGARPSCRPGNVSDCAGAVNAASGGVLDGPAGANWSCGPSAPIGATFQTSGRCSRDPNRLCCPPGQTCPNVPNVGGGTWDGKCAAGDVCVATGLAPTDGCWDATVQSCRFTPRLILEDNWGWCSGECRKGIQGGQLVDDTNPASPISKVLHKYGGCWSGGAFGDASPSAKSNQGTILTDVNECKTQFPSSSVPGGEGLRPWIVYQGSLQLRLR